MRALKVLVIVMGIAIVVATTVLVMLIVQRGVRLASGTPESASAPAPVPAQQDAAPVRRLALPAGGRVLESRLAEGRLLLRVALPEGGETLLVFDAASGQPLAEYRIGPGAVP